MKKFRRLLLQIFIGILLCIGLLELAYRYQWGDFYAVEWQYFNAGILKDSAKREVLVMGDSFSTSEQGYVEKLRVQFPEWNIANSAIPGTGVVEASYLASRRFSDRKPDTFIYQIYLGNDLFDLQRPVNWGELGLMRNLYWWSANRMRSLSWINYKGGQFQASPEVDAKEFESGFQPERYNQREKRYFESEPDWIREQGDAGNIHWKRQRERYFNYLEDLMKYPESNDTKILLLVIPHCTQVGTIYRERMESIGMASGQEVPSHPEDHIWLEELSEYAASHENMELLYPLDIFKWYEREVGPVYYPNDPHLNSRGQFALALAVEEWLREN